MNNKWKNSGNSEEQIPDDLKIITVEKQQMDINPQGNKIYFYSDISRETILNLNRQIDELAKQMKIIQFTYNLPEPPQIEIHICSEGGDIFEALASVDKIINNEIPIHTFVEGTAASAATLLSVCGHKRFITKNSCLLLHQMVGNFWGTFSQLVDEHANFQLIMKILKNVYLQKTKFTSIELDELLKHDLYMESSKCLKKGLVDYII